MEEAKEPIQIRPGTEGQLIVRLPCTAERVAKIKTISGRRWHDPQKYWTVPNADGMAPRLLTLFAGERVELAPSLLAAATSEDPLLESIRKKPMSPGPRGSSAAREQPRQRRWARSRSGAFFRA